MVLLSVVIHQSIINIVIIGFVIMFLGFLLKKIKQPVIIAYILAGIIVGPSGLGILKDKTVIDILGELGLILLLFFIGMEISLPSMFKMWKTALLGVLFQVLISVLLISIIGYYFDWSINRIVILGFVLSLSSSAVVIKLMDEKKEIKTPIGQSVLSILLMQDMVIVPMLLITDFLGGEIPSVGAILLQIFGGIIILIVFWYIIKNKTIKVPFAEKIKSDHETQVFIAVLFSFGLAILTSLIGLSAALGAFFAGIIVHAADATEWVHDSLHAFRVAFVSMFFVSIGMLIDLSFLFENYLIILFLLVSVYITNNLINTLILQYFCKNWKNSIYGGAMLAQVGELGFVVLGVAYLNNSISEYTYQLTIITISLTLLISPMWIMITEKITNR